MLQTITALVPIKGASERVPGKNLRSFCGKPLLYYVLNTLQEHEYIDKIIVNTDSEKVIQLVSIFSKVQIHTRPKHLCGHHIPMNHVLAYDLEQCGPGTYLQTHVTNPMLTAETIAAAIRQYFMHIGQYDSLFSVLEHKSRFYLPDMTPLNHNPSVLLNTQDLSSLYEENSCLYIFSYDSFFNNKQNRIGNLPQLFPMPGLESLDIDTEDDFRLAEVAHMAFEKKTIKKDDRI